MFNNEAQAASAILVFGPIAASNTAAASSNWFDVRGFEGDILVIHQVNVTSGSYLGALEDAADATGASAASMTFNEGALPTVVPASLTFLSKRTFNANITQGFIRNRGTVTTGPANVSVTMLGRPKNF